MFKEIILGIGAFVLVFVYSAFAFLLALCVFGLVIWVASWMFPLVASFFIEWISWFLNLLEEL